MEDNIVNSIKKKIKKSNCALYIYFRIKMLINSFAYKHSIEDQLKKILIRNVGYIPNFKNPKSYI